MKATASCYNTFVAFLEPECKASPIIENLWSLLITKAARTQKIAHIERFKRTSDKEWINLPRQFVSKVVESVKNPVNDLIQSAGEYILHLLLFSI